MRRKYQARTESSGQVRYSLDFAFASLSRVTDLRLTAGVPGVSDIAGFCTASPDLLQRLQRLPAF